jgi:hypothetical protein
MVLNTRASSELFFPLCSVAEALAQATSCGELTKAFSSADRVPLTASAVAQAEREGELIINAAVFI